MRMCPAQIGAGLSAAILVVTTVASFAADTAIKALGPVVPSPPSQTLTGDWFGQGPALRDAGFDVRLEWSQFYQGLTQGNGDKRWAYGGKWDAQAIIDLHKLGFWSGLSFTIQGAWNHGNSVNGNVGTLTPVNAALFTPGIDGSDRSDILALYFTQTFDDLVTVSIGKLNNTEAARRTPIRGGGGVDTFWNSNVATPITGIGGPTLFGGEVKINTQPVSFGFTVFDAADRTNMPLFESLFQAGVNFKGTATFKTSIAGLTGYYGVKALYSTREGPDFGELIPSVVNGVLITRKGSYFVGVTMQQYLVQDPSNSTRGWGIFGEIGKTDGNPNALQWMGYFGGAGYGVIPGRPDDRFGIAYFRYDVSDTLQATLAPLFQVKDESGVEIFYNIAVTPWFRVAANLQFIRPALGGSDVVLAGLGTYLRF